MISQKSVLATGAILLIMSLLVACASPAAAPTAIPTPPTATLVPSTPTPVLPTVTPMPDTPVPASPSQASTGKATIESGEITSQALAGNLLGDPTTRTFYVLLPPGYETSDKRYPVVYGLHGYTDTPTYAVGPFKRAYENILGSGDAQEMIFVFPDAHNKLGGSWYMSSPTIGDYETYITDELVTYIDETYRTIPDSASRGITGCSDGGHGAMHLALTHPNVFAVAAGMSGTYDYESDPLWEQARSAFRVAPEDLGDFRSLPWPVQWYMAGAAATASNPDNPPFYLDMPFEMVDGEGQIVADVAEKINSASNVQDLDAYLQQPARLNAVMLYHGVRDPYAVVEIAHSFDALLTEKGVDHEYLEIDAGHCHTSFPYDPVVKFMSDNLVGEE